MDVNTQATTEPKDIGQILEDGRSQVAADVPAPAQERQRDQTDAGGPDDNEARRDRTAPLAVLISERKQRKAAQQRAAELESQLQEALAAQQPAFEPQQNQDAFWADPDRVLAQQTAATNFRVSKAEFKADFGKAAYDDLEQTVEAAEKQGHPDFPHLVAAMRQSPDPIAVAKEWAEAALGWSPDGQQQQKGVPHYGMVMPSNLAAARNVGARSGPKWSGQPSIGDILKSAGQPRDIFKR